MRWAPPSSAIQLPLQPVSIPSMFRCAFIHVSVCLSACLSIKQYNIHAYMKKCQKDRQIVWMTSVCQIIAWRDGLTNMENAHTNKNICMHARLYAVRACTHAHMHTCTHTYEQATRVYTCISLSILHTHWHAHRRACMHTYGWRQSNSCLRHDSCQYQHVYSFALCPALYVWRNSFITVTWLFHTRDMTNPTSAHLLFSTLLWSNASDMNHSYDSFEQYRRCANVSDEKQDWSQNM